MKAKVDLHPAVSVSNELQDRKIKTNGIWQSADIDVPINGSVTSFHAGDEQRKREEEAESSLLTDRL
jgi:hypothetical protein